MKQISILGCGWLGLPLAKKLIEKGFSVSGTTTSFTKIQELKENRIEAFQVEVLENSINGDVKSFLENSEILIINIPPKLRGNSKENFVAKIQNLIPFIEKSTIKNVVFVSSTSVYGTNNSDVTETTLATPETESGKQLLQAESLLQRNASFNTTILRFGGLIGEDRHPVKFLAGRKNLENPDSPINLIHLEDCIGIILEILRTPEASGQNDKLVWNQIYNAVAPFHPTRKEYYTQKAIELNLPLPEFENSTSSNSKIISNSKVTEFLKYTFVKTKL